MFDQDKAYRIRWDVPIHVNGTIVNMVAEGEGCARDGKLVVDARFDGRPDGFDAAVILMWTSSDSTIFGRELDGTVNLGRITDGNYNVIRTIDMNVHGHLECAWTKRFDPNDDTIYTAGVVTGSTAVHEAVVAMLGEQPWEELSVPQVAQRSGLHPATIYRRWGTMTDLLNDVMAGQLGQLPPIPDTGSLRGDLEVYAAGVAGHLEGPLGTMIPRLAGAELEPGPRTRMFPALAERERQLQVMLDRAAERSELPPSVAEVEELLLAPLYFHALFTAPLPAGDTPRLVDRLLALTAAGR